MNKSILKIGAQITFTLGTPKKLPRPSRVCTSEKSQVSERCDIKEAMCDIPMVEVVGVPRLKSGPDPALVSKNVLNFSYTNSKMQSIADLKSLKQIFWILNGTR